MTDDDARMDAIMALKRITIPDPVRRFKMVGAWDPHGVRILMTMEAKERDFPMEDLTISHFGILTMNECHRPQPERDQQLLYAVRRLAHHLVTHEVDEWLHYERKRTNDPHA